MSHSSSKTRLSRPSDTPIAILARERAVAFRKHFRDTSAQLFHDRDRQALYHPGEYGRYREHLVKDLLKAFLPNYLSLSEGFVVCNDGARSTQTDVVIYDNTESPNLEADDSRRFFPIETVCGIGEIKSDLTVAELKLALDKLKGVKMLRLKKPVILVPARPSWRVQEVTLAQYNANSSELDSSDRVAFLQSLYDPVEHHWQNLVSFLVCQRLTMSRSESFQQVVEGIVREVASEEGFAMRHNMLLSLEDGYQSYSLGPGIAVTYPRLYDSNLGMSAATGIRTVPANDDCDHIIAFIVDLCSSVGDTAIYPFTLAGHLSVEFKYAVGA